MAKNEKQAAATAPEEKAVQEAQKPKSKPTVYNAAELIAAAPQAFGVSSAIAAGALYGKPSATKAEAEKLIKEFTAKTIDTKGAK